MAVPAGKVPIFESAGQAVRFLRENWRFALAAAAIGALAQAVGFLALGISPAWLILLAIIGAFVHAAFLNAALSGVAGGGARIFGDGGRVLAAMAIIGFFVAIISFMVIYVVMGVLTAPFENELKAAGQNTQQIMAILDRAVASQPNVLAWAMTIGAALIFLLTSRLYLVAPASVDQKRIVVFESWRWTKGNLLRIAASRIVVLGPALLLVGALQSIAALLLGAPGGDPAAMAAAAAANPVQFTLFYAVAGFIQLGLYGALEAGLATYLYRGLHPVAPPPAG